jgi:hypothetical protein
VGRSRVTYSASATPATFTPWTATRSIAKRGGYIYREYPITMREVDFEGGRIEQGG